MKVESYNEQYRERYGLILNTYVDVCSLKMRSILELQDRLFSEKGAFEQICQEIKHLSHAGKTKDEIKAAMQYRLAELNETLPATYQLPLDPRVEVGKIVVKKCKIMSSAKLPLWLEFENAEEGRTLLFECNGQSSDCESTERRDYHVRSLRSAATR